MDATIWGNLPRELVEKICNMLPHVRRIPKEIRDDIVNQWSIFDRYYWNTVILFGFWDAYGVMYDDIRNVIGLGDDLPEEMPLEIVVHTLWTRLTPEDRTELLLTT